MLGVSGQSAQVQEAVYGIVFLGKSPGSVRQCPVRPCRVANSSTDYLATPHNGSSIAACGSVLANMAQRISPLNPPRAILEALKKDSKVLSEITDDFVPRASSLHIVSFYEMRMTRIGLWNTMVRLIDDWDSSNSILLMTEDRSLRNPRPCYTCLTRCKLDRTLTIARWHVSSLRTTAIFAY